MNIQEVLRNGFLRTQTQTPRQFAEPKIKPFIGCTGAARGKTMFKNTRIQKLLSQVSTAESVQNAQRQPRETPRESPGNRGSPKSDP